MNSRFCVLSRARTKTISPPLNVCWCMHARDEFIWVRPCRAIVGKGAMRTRQVVSSNEALHKRVWWDGATWVETFIARTACNSRQITNAQNLCRSTFGTSESSLPKIVWKLCAHNFCTIFAQKMGLTHNFCTFFLTPLGLRLGVSRAQFLHNFLSQVQFLKICGCTGQRCLKTWGKQTSKQRIWQSH